MIRAESFGSLGLRYLCALNRIERRVLLRDVKDQHLFCADSSAKASREYPILVSIAMPLRGSALRLVGCQDLLDYDSVALSATSSS
jgi:hypothetical protein